MNIFFPIISPTEYVIFISSIIQTVFSWVRPGGIRALIITSVRNYDLAHISNYIFILVRSVRSSSN